MARRSRATVLAKMPSRSNPNQSYEIRLGKDDRVYCTCPKWKFSRNHECHHLDAYRALMTRRAA